MLFSIEVVAMALLEETMPTSANVHGNALSK